MEAYRFKRKYALTIFILILLAAKLSEPRKETEPKPEKTMVYIEDGRVICREGFFDLPKAEREIMLKKVYKSLHN